MEILAPMVNGFPGKKRVRLMSELKELLKYSGFIGSGLFLDLLSEMKLTFEVKFQKGFDFCCLLCDHVTVSLLFLL